MDRVGTTRRSVTVRPELNSRLREFVAACLRHNIDLDYTKAFNLFAELGVSWLEDSDHTAREKVSGIWASYLDYARLESSETLNDWREYEEFREWKMAKARRDAAKAKKTEIAAAR